AIRVEQKSIFLMAQPIEKPAQLGAQNWRSRRKCLQDDQRSGFQPPRWDRKQMVFLQQRDYIFVFDGREERDPLIPRRKSLEPAPIAMITGALHHPIQMKLDLQLRCRMHGANQRVYAFDAIRASQKGHAQWTLGHIDHWVPGRYTRT